MPLSRAATLALSPTRELGIARVSTLAARAGALAFAALVSISIAGMQIALGIAAAGVVVAWATGARAFRRSPLDAPVLLLTGAAIASVGLAWAAGTPPPSLFRATLWKTFLTPLLVATALELPSPGEPPGAPRRRALAVLCAWAAGAIVVGLITAVQPWTGFDPLWFAHSKPVRITAERASWPGHFHAVGFFTQYAVLPVTMLPPLALAAGVAALAPLAPARRGLLAAGALAGALASILSLTRVTFLSLAVVAVTVVLAAGRRAGRALVAAALVAAITLAIPGVRSRLATGVSLAANADRLLIWRVCEDVRRDHPWTGVGIGNFGSVAGPYFDRVDPAWPVRTACHDATLTFLVEGGPLVLAASLSYWALLAVGFARARREAARRGDALGRAAAVGALATVAGAFANGIFHDVFHASEPAYALGLALGCAAVLSRPIAEAVDAPAPRRAAPPS